MAEHNGHGPSAHAVPIMPRLHRVPKDGRSIVRFLSRFHGLLTHRPKSADIPCPGPEDCPPAVHRQRSRWKGYAAALIWRGERFGDWIPGVFEITQALESTMPAAGIVGECWELYREPGESGHLEVSGRYIDSRPTPVIDAMQWLVPVLNKVYSCSSLHLDVPNPFRAQIALYPVSDPPPSASLLTGKRVESVSPEDARKAKELLREEMKKLGIHS